MKRTDVLELFASERVRSVDVPGLGAVRVRRLRLSELLGAWERGKTDAQRQLELVALSVVDEEEQPLASADEWDRVLGSRPTVWPVLVAAVNETQGFLEDARGN